MNKDEFFFFFFFRFELSPEQNRRAATGQAVLSPGGWTHRAQATAGTGPSETAGPAGVRVC